MRNSLLLLAALSGLAQAETYRTTLGIAPPIVLGGDLSSDLVQPFQTVLAEIVSWEASMIPGIRVVDPVALAQSLEAKGWSSRTGLGNDEIEDARMSGRQQDADAVLLVQAIHSGGGVDWKAAVAYRDGTQDRSNALGGRIREDDFLLAARASTLDFLDSMRVQVPPAARQAVSERGRVPWVALLEYSRGVRDQQAGRAEEALRHLRDASRRAPFLPALQVRLKKLERDNPGK